MMRTGTFKATSRRGKLLAIAAVLIMVLSVFVVISDRAPIASATPETQTSLEAEVVYHAAAESVTVDTDYNVETPITTTKIITYYGTVVSTEYNPQVWEFSTERWFAIQKDGSGKEKYADGQTIVFTGWKFATAGTVTDGVLSPTSFTAVQDPGDIVLYNSGDKHWYVGSDRVDIDMDGNDEDEESTPQIHVYATWGPLVHSITNPTTVTTWSDGSKFQNIVLVTGSKRLDTELDNYMKVANGYTIRASKLSDVAASVLNDGNKDTTYTLQNPIIIDNISMQFLSGKAGQKLDINTGSKSLIIGSGINSIKTAGSKTNDGYYGQYISILGGSSGNNKIIIHSGTYSCVYGGGKSGYRSETIMNGGIVLDTLCGGTISGGSTTGDLYLYLTGVTAYSDTYTDYLLNHEHSGTKVAAAGDTTIVESSMVVGGNTNKEAKSTHVFLTGTSDVWTIQAAGRASGSTISQNAEMEISGKAIVRNVACGGTTDALPNTTETSTIMGNINIRVRDAPLIASLAGGGYDTYEYSNGACFLGTERSINLTIDGGTIGYVYGGGLRGPIGTETNPTNINITINDGNILKDVYGGGSGTLVKIKHKTTGGTVATNHAYEDTTGKAYVYGNVNISMTGGTVNGSVYGGGKSVAMVSNYGGATGFTTQQDYVAMVKGNTTVSISGGEVAGSVFGAGRGMDTSVLVSQDAVNSEYSSLFVIRNKEWTTTPVLKDPNKMVRGDVPLTEDLELAYIPWAKQDLNSTSKVSVTFVANENKYMEYAKVTGNTAVNISGDCVIQGSVYGGGQIGKLYGSTGVHITGGTVMGMVYGGGLGTIGRMSVRDIRRITVGGTANIVGSVYGGSALGTDGLTDALTADVFIYIKAGKVGGSIFGGGFQGTTYGDVHMYIGVDSLELGDSSMVLDDTEDETTLTIGESIYLGGDVGVLTDSSQAYKTNMVMGSGELFMEQNSSVNNISFKGTIMGSGNSCLTKGETTIHLKNLTTFSSAAAEAIHRATKVTLEGCVLELNGRATIENTIKDVKDTNYTLYRVEDLVLKGGTILVLNGAIDYVYQLDSHNDNGDPTTATSPLNKIVVGGGNMFIIKSIQWDEEHEGEYTESYGEVNGFIILAARSNEQQYGVMALGDPESEGGFVILKTGTFERTDFSDLTEDCRCWYLAGAINNEVTVTASTSGVEDVAVDMPSLQSGSSYRYTGGTFIPNSPGDANLISTDGSIGENQFEVRFGCDDYTENCLVFADDPDHPEKGALMKNDLGQGDPILGLKTGGASVRNPYMIIELKSTIEEFKYIGYVLICVNEVVEVRLSETETTYIVVNSIQTKVHINTASSDFGEDTNLDISIVDGVGSAVFMIPSGKAGYSFIVDSITPQSGANGVSAFGVTSAKNMNSTPGWTDSLGTFAIRTDGILSSTKIGTLQGGYNASLKVQVNSFTGNGTEYYDMAVRIVKDGETPISFVITLAVSKTPDVSVTFHVNESTQLRYTYSYGTAITLPDCPPTDDHFVGWYTDSSFNNPFTFTFPLTRDMDLYARYMYEVTMDYMDGTSSVVYVAMPSGYIGSMDDPEREGYSFGGWYADTDYQHHWDLATDEVTESMTLYARWVGWSVKVNFQVNFGSGVEDVDLDPSHAQHTTGDLLNAQIMEFGTKFDMTDNFYVGDDPEPRNMSLLDWAQYNLAKMQEYTEGGYKFIYWTYKVEDAPGKAVPVYSDSILTETKRLLTDGSGYVQEDGCYVVVLFAKVEKIALKVEMDSRVMVGDESVDNLALVDPPSSFLIFPYQQTEDTYDMTIDLNGATRPGYSLKGWKVVQRTDGSADFTEGADHIYEAGTKINLHIIRNLGGDSGTYPWIAYFQVSEHNVATMKITETGAARMTGEGTTENLVIEFLSQWERIPYSVSIADPAHGSIVALYDDHGTPVQFDDGSFFYGDSITLVFTPDAGYEFHHWYTSGEGIFNSETSLSTTFVVQGDTNISAYLIGPQIVRIYVEYDGLYREIGVDGKLNNGGTEYTVEAVRTGDVITTANGIKFLVTAADNHVTVFSVPAGITVHVDDVLTVDTVDYTVDAVTEALKDPYNCAKFLVTNAPSKLVTVVEYYIDESAIPDLYWKNGADKVHFTKSVYTAGQSDLANSSHILVQYTGTAVLGTHNIYLEGREFGSEYNLGMPITSTTLQNVYYLMTSKVLYSMAGIPSGAATGTDSSKHVNFAITNPAEGGVTVSAVNDTSSAIINVPTTVTDDISHTAYTVEGIAPGAVSGCTAMKMLVINSDNIIYRYGFVTIYTNNVKDHTSDSNSDAIAGKGTGIVDMTEYNMNYYLGDNPEGAFTTTGVILTLDLGYYSYYDPNGAFVDNSTSAIKNITVTGYITGNVLRGSIGWMTYTIDVYYGKDDPAVTGNTIQITGVHYGDNYLDLLGSHKDVPTTSYKVYAWYMISSGDLISSSMTVSGDPDEPIQIFGKYLESINQATVWIRTQVSSDRYSDISYTMTVKNGSSVHYSVDVKSGYVAKYNTDLESAVSESYLTTKVYATSYDTDPNPITVSLGSGEVIVITYYCAVVDVRIFDAVHDGSEVLSFIYGQTVPLVHHTDTVDTHYEGWTRNGDEIDVPMEGYAISLADVSAGTIVLRETWSTREYTVNIVTSLAEIHSGSKNLGGAVSLSIPYGTTVTKSADGSGYITRLTVGSTTYVLSEYTPYINYYDMSQGDWIGVPAGEGMQITGNTVISYRWVSMTYTLRVVYDETVTVSGTNGTDAMLFSNVVYSVQDTKTTYKVESGDLAGVQFIVTDDGVSPALVTVIYIPDGKTVTEGQEFEYESSTYRVSAINTDVKETDSGIKFIVTDWLHSYVTITDLNEQPTPTEVVQNGPNGTVTKTPGALGYNSIIRLTLVFSGSYTIDGDTTKYINPAGGTYPLEPKKQSSMQEWVIQFFVTGNMEITIHSKWEGEHVNFFIKGTAEGALPIIDPSMTILVARGGYVDLPIADYEWISRLDIEHYYFDGWYTDPGFTLQPLVVYHDDKYWYRVEANKSLYARYVPLLNGDCDLIYDGTAQHPDVIPQIEIPLDVSDITYTYDETETHSISITDVGDPINHKTVTYTFTPSKVYKYIVDDVTYYVLGGVSHAYTDTFTLNMDPCPVIVIANGQTKMYDGTAIECSSYSVFGLKGGSLTDGDPDVDYSGSRTAVGRSACSVTINNVSDNYTVTYYNGTLTVIGAASCKVTSKVAPAGTAFTGTEPIAISYADSKVTVTQGDVSKEFPGSSAEILLEDTVITAGSAPAISIGEGCSVNIVVKGECILVGGTGYDGICVSPTASLVLTGPGTLTVKGNGESDASGHGSGIGYAEGTPGSITVTKLAGLTAYGYGTGGYGIGGSGAEVTIEHSAVTAQGGFADATDTDGAPGIGGSDIFIKHSVVTATGGCYSAAIGSGYGETEMCIITITDDSKITATGGRYAASIGTGYRHAKLTGFIDGSCSVTLPVRTESDMVKDDSPSYYGAQYVGYGVVDPAGEAAGLSAYFYRGLAPIPAPAYTVAIAVGIENGTVAADKAAAVEGETIILTFTPDSGYQLASASYLEAGSSTPVSIVGTTFEMPAASVTVTAVFEVIP